MNEVAEIVSGKVGALKCKFNACLQEMRRSSSGVGLSVSSLTDCDTMAWKSALCMVTRLPC